jgi:hypothetical protein
LLAGGALAQRRGGGGGGAVRGGGGGGGIGHTSGVAGGVGRVGGIGGVGRVGGVVSGGAYGGYLGSSAFRGYTGYRNGFYNYGYRGYYGYGGIYWPYTWGLGYYYDPYYWDYGYYPYSSSYGYGYPGAYQPNVTVVYPEPQSAPVTVYSASPVVGRYDQYGQEIGAPGGPANSSPLYLIAFKDHVIRPALAYSVTGDTLHYTTLDREDKQVPLDSVDRDLSRQLNRERRVPFDLPGQ